MDSADIAVAAAAAPARFARRLPFGRYRLEVREPGGMAITSLRFRAGWAGGETRGGAGQGGRRRRPPRLCARARPRGCASRRPSPGRASVAVLTDRLVSMREIEVAEGGTEIEVPVEAAWGPGAYVAVTVFRPGEARARASRAGRSAWPGCGLDPPRGGIEVAIEAPDRDPAAPARSRCRCRLGRRDGAHGAMLTLAAVDEGILRLTRFAIARPGRRISWAGGGSAWTSATTTAG